jgi:hypothetical protein
VACSPAGEYRPAGRKPLSFQNGGNIFLRNVCATGHHNTEFTKYLRVLQCLHLRRGTETINNAKCDTFFSSAAKDSSLLGRYFASPAAFYRCVEELYCPRLQFQAFQNVGLELLNLRKAGKSLPVGTP